MPQPVLSHRSFEAIEEFLGLLFMQFEFGADGGGIAAIEAVFGKLLFFHQPDVAIGLVQGPAQVINAFHALEEGTNALKTIGEFGENGTQNDPAALLEVGELRDLETVQKYLPADAPSAEGGRLPVVLFETNVMLFQVDAQGRETLQIDILHILRRGFEDHLKLEMLVQAIGILTIAPVGGPTAGLHITDSIGMRSENAEERFRVHGARAHFDIIRLLKNAALPPPELREFQNQILKGGALPFFLKFYFNFQEVSKSARVLRRRSL